MAFDSFLDLYDSNNKALEGESIDSHHSKMLQIKTFNFGNEHPTEIGLGTGNSSGKTKFIELNIDINQSKASPTLFLWSCTGEHLQKGILYVRKNGGKPQDFMIITMTGLFVTKFTTTAADGADAMQESVSFAYTSIQYEYHQQDEKGAVSKTAFKAGWDQKKNDTYQA